MREVVVSLASNNVDTKGMIEHLEHLLEQVKNGGTKTLSIIAVDFDGHYAFNYFGVKGRHEHAGTCLEAANRILTAE